MAASAPGVGSARMTHGGSPSARLREIFVTGGTTLRKAMEAIDRGGAEIALLVDSENRLVGTVSDGDIRRALLQGVGLDDEVAPFANRNPHVVPENSGRAAVLDLMNAWYISAVPVVDSERRVVGLHVMQELLGAAERPNWAVIMAGGRGVRLAPLTETVPKPMLRVAGRPILERLVLHLVGSGIRTVFISLNYLGEVIERHFRDGSAFGCEIEYLREEPETPLGTGGALSLLATHGFTPTDPLIVLNGDLVTDFSVRDMLDSHQASGCTATVAVREYSHPVPYGVAELHDDAIVRFIEKPVASWTVNAGIYVLDPSLLELVPADRNFPMTELLDVAIGRGQQVNAWHSDGDWQDVGHPAELRRARGDA